MTGGGSTNAYNLMEGMGLTDYSYPKLQGIPHYGDWKAEFESGSLAYYEHYQNGTAAGYGFLGGNVSSLRDDETVLGDGYGMIYDSKPTASVTVTIGPGRQRASRYKRQKCLPRMPRMPRCRSPTTGGAITSCRCRPGR